MSSISESINDLQVRTLDEYKDTAKSAADTLRAISEIALRQAKDLEEGRYTYTDFVSSQATRYAEYLIKMKTLSDSLSKLNWLARQVEGENA